MRARRVPVDALPILLLAFLALLAAAACAPQPPAETETATSPGSGAAPDPLVDTYLERYFAFYPSRATAAGLHTHDGELEDLTPERIDAWVAFNRETVEQLEQAAAAVLAPEHREVVRDAAGLPVLIEAMRAHGYGEALIARIARENWLALLERTAR